MAIEQFNVQSSPPVIVNNFLIGLIVIGTVLLVINVLLFSRLKNSSSYDEGEKRVGIGIGIGGGKYTLAIFGIGLIVMGGFGYVVTQNSLSPSIVTIGDGYVTVESTNFVRNGAILSASGNMTVTSEECSAAFVGQVGSGDFTLHKEYGSNFGDVNIGIYTLGNGAKAYVASTNSTNLIVELKNGEYLIVGNQNTQAIASSFAQNVCPLTP